MLAPAPAPPLDDVIPGQRPYISLVLPAFNEEENIEEAVAQAVPPLAAISPEWEIIIVNDASTDGTGVLAERIAGAYPGQVTALHFGENHGLGMALRAGFAAARGQVLAYCDSDLPFDMWTLHEAHQMFADLQVDMIAGYRHNREVDGLRRLLYSWLYNGLVRLTFGLRVRDVNFSLKMFRREIFDQAGLQSDGSFIDVELLARAHQGLFRVAQIGVHYTPRVRGTSTLARPAVIVGILHEMLLFRLGRLRGRPTPALVVL